MALEMPVARLSGFGLEEQPNFSTLICLLQVAPGCQFGVVPSFRAVHPVQFVCFDNCSERFVERRGLKYASRILVQLPPVYKRHPIDVQRLSNSRTFGWESKWRVRHLRHQHRLELTSVKMTLAPGPRFLTRTRLTTVRTRVNTTEVRNHYVRYCPRVLYCPATSPKSV